MAVLTFEFFTNIAFTYNKIVAIIIATETVALLIAF